MAGRITPFPYRKVARALRRLGFHPIRQVGSQVRFQHSDGGAVTMPHHAAKDIDPWLVARILREAALTLDEFLAVM